MDAYRCIVTKRELRSFTDRPIPDDVLRKVLNAGRMSGSSRNRQPWHFIVVRDRDRLRRLSTCGRFAQHIATAVVAVAIVIDEPGQAFDAGRCAQNMMLAAWHFGIASCPASMHRADEAKGLLEVPADKVISIVISLGQPHPNGRRPIERTTLRILTSRGRRPLAALLFWERFGASDPDPPPL